MIHTSHPRAASASSTFVTRTAMSSRVPLIVSPSSRSSLAKGRYWGVSASEDAVPTCPFEHRKPEFPKRRAERPSRSTEKLDLLMSQRMLDTDAPEPTPHRLLETRVALGLVEQTQRERIRERERSHLTSGLSREEMAALDRACESSVCRALACRRMPLDDEEKKIGSRRWRCLLVFVLETRFATVESDGSWLEANPTLAE